MRLWLLVVLGCVGCVGCAGSKPKPSVGGAGVVAASEAVEVERRPYAELTEPPAADAALSPGLWLQLANVAQLVSKLPASIQAGPGMQRYKELAPLVSNELGADVGSVIDLSQPVDLAMAMPQGFESPSPVIAFRVRSPEAIEHGEAGLTLRRVASGMWLMGDEPLPPPAVLPDESAMDDDEEAPEDEEGEEPMEQPSDPRLPCVLAHAPPPVGYRVLCGFDLDHVRASSAFLLRDTKIPTAEVHVELAGPAYHAVIDNALEVAKRAGQKEAETQSGGDRLGAEAGLAIVEALGAHERLSVDVRLGSAGVDATLDIAFPESAATTRLQQWARSASARRLPGGFALLPRDNDFALSFSGLGQETAQSFLTLLLGELLTDMSQEYTLSASELRELSASFSGILPTDAHFSVATGADVDAIEQVLEGDAVAQADEAGRALTPAAVKQLQTALGGWITVALEVPAKDYLPAIDRMLRANKIPMRRRPGMPRKPSEREDSTMRRQPVTTRGLPAGTVHIVDQVRPAKTYRPPANGSEPPVLPYDSHWLVVPDGQRVWIVGARNEALAGQRALLVLRGTGAGKLAAQAEIQPLAERPLLGACSFNLGGMRLQFLDWDSVSQRRAARRQIKRYGKQLHTAKTPMLLTLEVAPPPANGAPGFGFHARLLLSQAALSELWDSGAPIVPVP